MDKIYDIIILGGGPGGYLAGERAAQAGLSACIVEARAVGGVCLNEGCIPTKTLLNSAKIFDYAKSDRYGVSFTGACLDHQKVLDRKNMVVKQLVTGVKSKLKALGVDVVEARGMIQGRVDGLYLVQAGACLLAGKRLIIATGSEAAVPPIPGAAEGRVCGFVMTNRELLDHKALPERLCVVGGGVIGLEMASYYASAGSKVTVLEMLPQIGGAMDGEIAAVLQKNLRKKGVTFHLGCKVTCIDRDCVVRYEECGEAKELPSDLVLLSTGRRPNLQGIGLESIGVTCSRQGVCVNDTMQTNVPDVYAVGDVTGRMMLAHVAYRHAEVAINHITGKSDVMSYAAVPSVIYTNPEVAACGETLATAREKGMDAREVQISMRYSGRYLAEVAGGDGICKLVFGPDNRLLGVHMIGSYVSEIIFGATLLIGQQMSLEEMKKVIFPHPSVCEVIREGFFEIEE